jgi:hypothetical protein
MHCCVSRTHARTRTHTHARSYAGFVNHLAIGSFMERNIMMRGGQTPVQRYWRV